MPKYYCDYCDTYLTHDSPSVRKTHCNGRKHKENVRLYYQKWLEEQVQKLVDDTTAAFKAGKIANNPFQNSTPSASAAAAGAMVPPPSSGKTTAASAVSQGGPITAIPGGPMPGGMPLLGGPMGHPGPMPPMMPVGMRPPMGPHMGPHMGPMVQVGMRPPLMAGPPPNKMPRK